MNWQPIDTAPDNQRVLLFCPELDPVFNPARVELGYAVSYQKYNGGNPVRGTMSSHAWATHWLPLPAFPEKEVEE